MLTLRTLFTTAALLMAMPSLPASALQRDLPQNANNTVLLDANHASVYELETLKGIGPRKAKAIVEERQQRGRFVDARDLTRVKGIGQALADKLGGQLSFHQP